MRGISALQILENQIEFKLDQLDIKDLAKQKAKKLIQAGAIEPSDVRSTDFTQAKAIITVVLEELTSTNRPLSDVGRSIANNFRKF